MSKLMKTNWWANNKNHLEMKGHLFNMCSYGYVWPWITAAICIMHLNGKDVILV